MLPDAPAVQAEDTLKGSCDFGFLGIENDALKCELEKYLLDRLRDFVREHGYGFCFVGRQSRLTLGDKDFFIDILFYHRFLTCLLGAMELIVGEFQPEFAGKRDFSMNVSNDKDRAPDDNPSNGIIRCAEKKAV